jgi:hypothetical protein
MPSTGAVRTLTERASRAEAGCWVSGVPDTPTLARDGDCTCTWVVISCGPGLAAVSRLKYRHAACRVWHETAHG